MKKTAKESILKTLEYSAIFDYPLSKTQLREYLQGKCTWDEFEKALRDLLKTKRIKNRRNIYKLRSHTKYVPWKQRQVRTHKLRKKYSKILRKLEKIPWIQLIAFTGSIAAGNPTPGDDVDILIITKPKRLWLTRPLVDMYIKSWKLYPKNGDYRNKICPNLMLTTKKLEWDIKEQNIFTANEIARLTPILNRNNTYEKFLAKNIWINKFLPNFPIQKIQTKQKKEIIPNILDLLNFLAFLAQRIYMAPKKTNEIATLNLIHFKKHDNKGRVLEELQNITKNNADEQPRKAQWHQKL